MSVHVKNTTFVPPQFRAAVFSCLKKKRRKKRSTTNTARDKENATYTSRIRGKKNLPVRVADDGRRVEVARNAARWPAAGAGARPTPAAQGGVLEHLLDVLDGAARARKSERASERQKHTPPRIRQLRSPTEGLGDQMEHSVGKEVDRFRFSRRNDAVLSGVGVTNK